MKTKALRLAQLLAAAELVSALLLPGAYLFPFRFGLYADNWNHPSLLAMSFLSVLLVVLPAATLIGLLRRKLVAFWGLYISPVLSFTFGVGSLPLLSQIVPAGNSRTVLLVAINTGAIIAAIWLRLQLRRPVEGAVPVPPPLQ